jgi:phage baseplate assembly protein V
VRRALEDAAILRGAVDVAKEETVSELYGVYAARVLDVRDPKRLGRVRVKLSAKEVSGLERRWARLATLMAGNGSGSWFVPDPGDEVLVAFEGGDVRKPFVVGALWNPSAKPPERMDAAGQNPRRVLRTKGGHRIALDDGGGKIEITDASGNSIVLDTAGISITAAAKLKIAASTIEIDAGMLTVNAGMSKFSGIVQSDTLITNSVIAASYTPGAGNIW